MKAIHISFAILFVIGLVACNRKKDLAPKDQKQLCICGEHEDGKELADDYDKNDDFDDNREEGEDYDEEIKLASLKKYVLVPLVQDETCGCIVDGKIKYVLEDKEAFFVAFGDGTCDEWASVYWPEDKKGKYEGCKFKMDCSIQISNDEIISEDELTFIKTL